MIDSFEDYYVTVTMHDQPDVEGTYSPSPTIQRFPGKAAADAWVAAHAEWIAEHARAVMVWTTGRKVLGFVAKPSAGK